MTAVPAAGDAVRRQYEAYPYPARDPKDEAKRLVTGSPSHLDELTHHLFAGRISADPFRVLVAGGGTGDALVMLAQQTADAGLAAELTYLDLSEASRAIAEARIAARDLGGRVRFLTGSLLDIAALAPGPFDYIDCCGVLHHLDDPDAGLAALASVLAPGGGMGLMVYAPQGRAGVYPLQAALRQLAPATLPPAERVAAAKKLLSGLPPTNAFQRNPFLGDHKASDAGLHDLLLHSTDRPFAWPELAAWLARAGLAVAGMPWPILYDPATYIADPGLQRRLDGLDADGRAALAENLSGAMKTHCVYVARKAEAAGRAARFDADAVPVLRELDGQAIAARLRPGRPLPVSLGGLDLAVPLPPLGPAIIGLVDGTRDAGAIAAMLADRRRDLDRAAILAQIDATLAALTRIAKGFLRRPR
ncbi:MAG: class I SAM-dependent methyltransferase [Azospirillaceae bacterium]